MENFKIDRKNKTFVFDDGEVIPIPKDKEKQVLRSKSGRKTKETELENLKKIDEGGFLPESVTAFGKSLEESFLGNPGATIGNYIKSGAKALQTGEGQEEMGYVDRLLDHFYAEQEARHENLAGLQERNPIASTLGKGVGIGGELLSLRKLPGSAALPIIGAGQSETSFLEPGEKTKEVAQNAATGYVLDKFFGGLGKIASNRGAQRNAKNLINTTEQANAAEIERAAAATEADKLRYAQDTAKRQGVVGHLAKQHELEKEAFKNTTGKSVDRIATTLGKTPISAEVMGIEDFINSSINTSAAAATSEANYVSKFLRSVFKGDKTGKLSGDALKKGMQSLDEAILKNQGVTQELLSEYKNHISQTLPEKLATSYVFEKWAPKIIDSTKKLETDFSKVISDTKDVNNSLKRKLGPDYLKNFHNDVNSTVKSVVEGLKDNLDRVDANLIREEIQNSIKSLPSYLKILNRAEKIAPDFSLKQIYPKVASALDRYPQMIAERVANTAEKYGLDIGLDLTTKGGITQRALQNVPTKAPVLPQVPAVNPAQNIAPNLQPVPAMPVPTDIYGRLAQGLESINFGGAKKLASAAKNNSSAALLAKLSGIPVSKFALGGAAIAGAGKAITSPSMLGNLARGGVEQSLRAMPHLVDEMAQRYPSYQNGILNNPMERRSLTREIENLPDVPIEQKALLQSKINRGKPVTERL